MNTDSDNPFDLQNTDAYLEWRANKLDSLQHATLQAVEIDNPAAITPEESQALSSQIAIYNAAIFKLMTDPDAGGKILKSFGSQFDLHHLDSNLYANDNDISELRVIEGERRGEYIPYTNRQLGWHTDGYYNHPNNTIRTFILYCVNNASEGGANQFLDPELAYIHLRDQDSRLIEALMQPDAFTIPETIEEGKMVRPQQKNPVFKVDQDSGRLLMKYTQRKTHIIWNQDEDTQTALSLLGDLLASDSDHILNIRLNPGEGVICNNVLHNRSAFTDNPEHPRIMLRARYYDRFREYSDA